ncbi:hypothetical protein L1987_19241 [Smallanthus sonchifolius]|uniref:Uncharacterized protein n=1 Tax=Smallanthus sonchifolius TaxID=185202 RepID=A0ACB9IQL7_9ASTR|nr:hypothetical protein L1987_19241 [Smallanthus sonchifolius]
MIKPFVFPEGETVRMRWPAHAGTEEQVTLYREAIKAMRCLSKDHPHSFKSQAKIHCAYCGGAYKEKYGSEIRIHNTWLYFPFHRWYLYFYERILGKLIGRPDFSLPYWNWDDPQGMEFPEIFLTQYINVYRDLIKDGGDTVSFFGGPYIANNPKEDTTNPSAGSVENGTHTAVHVWVGNSKFTSKEDMGHFYSAGYGPLFYVHHANVDRMWKLWKDLGKVYQDEFPGHVEPKDRDWLDASYLFYDENEELVRVSNRDTIHLDKLKYNYPEIPIGVLQWRTSRPPKRNEADQMERSTLDPEVKPLSPVSFPMKLDKILKVSVERPHLDRIEEDKKKNEILKIERIEFTGNNEFVKFDVWAKGGVAGHEHGRRTEHNGVIGAKDRVRKSQSRRNQHRVYVEEASRRNIPRKKHKKCSKKMLGLDAEIKSDGLVEELKNNHAQASVIEKHAKYVPPQLRSMSRSEFVGTLGESNVEGIIGERSLIFQNGTGANKGNKQRIPVILAEREIQLIIIDKKWKNKDVVVFYFHDEFTWLKGAGLVTIIFGVNLFNWYQKLNKEKLDQGELAGSQTSVPGKYVIRRKWMMKKLALDQ